MRESAQDKYARMTMLEREYWANSCTVAGIDEVGRGPLAGPVVTACVLLPNDSGILGVDDSKKLSSKKREMLCAQILNAAVCVKQFWVDAPEIDAINILAATKKAMRGCAQNIPADVFFIDAVRDLGLNGAEVSIVHGDAASYSIAAASIVAKVARDEYMVKMDAIYPAYGFARNKGYGTEEHSAAIRRHGLCPLHRRSFVRNFV